MAKRKFKVGDRIIGKKDAYYPKTRGTLGKIIIVTSDDYGVEFVCDVGGHTCNGRGKRLCCWWLNSTDIDKVRKSPNKL